MFCYIFIILDRCLVVPCVMENKVVLLLLQGQPGDPGIQGIPGPRGARGMPVRSWNMLVNIIHYINCVSDVCPSVCPLSQGQDGRDGYGPAGTKGVKVRKLSSIFSKRRQNMIYINRNINVIPSGYREILVSLVTPVCWWVHLLYWLHVRLHVKQRSSSQAK